MDPALLGERLGLRARLDALGDRVELEAVRETREPVGDEIWMRAQTTLDAAGIGRTTGDLGDHGGAVARSAQCLFVEPRG